MYRSASNILKAVFTAKPFTPVRSLTTLQHVTLFGKSCHARSLVNGHASIGMARPLSTTCVLCDEHEGEEERPPRVAVVLSGCGVYDGTEIHEASAVLVHLSRWDSQVSIFAPDVNQMHVIDHTKGEPSQETRNVLVESARIARGKISPLSALKSADFDAVVFPGGFGAAKNLSTFAVDGTHMKVQEEVERVAKAFHSEGKVIGACCIAPVILAKLFPACEVTVGSDQEEGGLWPYAGTAGAIQEMGASHFNCDVTEAYVDEENKLVTSPAFMCETAVHEVHDGIGEMIDGVMDLIRGETSDQ